MADPRFPEIAELNEFGLPRHGDGVGPTLRPDIIAERHLHDWDAPAVERLTFDDDEGVVAAGDSLCAHAIAEDRRQRARSTALSPDASDHLDLAQPETDAGDNELQGARMAHAMAQGGENPTA